MASITVRNLDDDLKARLRARAAQHGRSMEEEVRALLQEALAAPTGEHPSHLVDVALSLFGPQHGVGLPPMPRAEGRPAPEFGR